MHSPVRVRFGLRASATDSDSEPWPGSPFSSLQSVSDDDSRCGEFHCEGDLPGFDAESLDSGLTPKGPANLHPSPASRNATTEPSTPAKESWSEIDERARRQEKQRSRVRASGPLPRSLRGRPKHMNSGKSEPRTPNYSDKSENWRSRPYAKRRPDRRPDKRRARRDPPLKGAVERPYTLPPGPLTVLRRPTIEHQDSADSEKLKLPGSSDLEHLGFVDDPAQLGGQGLKDHEHGQVPRPTGINTKVVTTRFGEGYVVENPSTEKTDVYGNKVPTKGTEMKVARNAATQAMAGLSMGSRDSDFHGISVETYDRGFSGHYRPSPRHSHKKSKDTSRNSADRHGHRPRPNVFIGRRPKLETRHVREDDFLVGE